ncbi:MULTISPECIES: VPLPA-CTERM sorting domain-containing protein [Thiorhodovibrio]|uniref:VPLPA-CTERM sorting domain-containing protein n=1 Tax=Thiorhodovibrio TaxID=61593 RepID=UPI0019113729|nr:MULTISPECIES: VPLPA-CTERM sorting domain-containing protein [Thiorhodovibrio]MBK5970778.1 hypothetical protein [Thiorhodovibrio winogradskyi]WPL10831.1 VPLPA-CTERM protein sorting domain protein [Thiorhodovibrio litoralis]
MKKSIFVAGLALATLTGANAYAAAIITEMPYYGAYFTAIKAAGGTVEDFEKEKYVKGPWNNSWGSPVGDFYGLGGTGSGTTCQASDNCEKIALTDYSINGQYGIFPNDQGKALNSNDKGGIQWNVNSATGFDMVAFAIRDAADQSGTQFKITAMSADGGTIFAEQLFTGGWDNEEVNVFEIKFDTVLNNAIVKLESLKADGATYRLNDAFTLDAVSMGKTAVPLPAAAWLFLSGLGVLGAMRKRKQVVA